MAIKTIKATMQMRRGHEEDFNPDQMTAGEWAVSTDSKKVWMCFQPGLVRRMATYEAFEQDMREIQLILATCQNIQVAVQQFENLAREHSVESKSWAVGGTGTREGEDTDNSKYYSEQAEMYKNSAENAIELSVPNFTVDLNTMHLLYEGGRFDFQVNNGHLEWGTVL